MTVNGVERARTTFRVTTAAGEPEIRLEQGSTYVIDERTTPIDFGSAALGGSVPLRTFTIRNHGRSPSR